jgi:hypothetical protein
MLSPASIQSPMRVVYKASFPHPKFIGVFATFPAMADWSIAYGYGLPLTAWEGLSFWRSPESADLCGTAMSVIYNASRSTLSQCPLKTESTLSPPATH